MAIETRHGEPLSASGRVLIPVARSLRLRLPGNVGGLVWNCPLGVVVKEGSTSRFLRVPGRTRQFQWGILCAGFVAAAFIRFRARRRRR